MNMLDLMNKMTQLSEAKEKTKTGLKHTAEPGGYGRKDDEDDEGHKVKATAVKKGKGRPKKDADDSGETKKYDFSAFGVKSGKDVKLPKHDKKKTTVVKGKSQSHADNKKDDGTDPETKTKKKGLKEYFDSLDKALNENEISSNRIDKMNKSNQEFYGKNPHFGRGAEIKDVGKTVDSNGKPISALATNITPKFNKPGQVQRIARGSFNSPVKESDYTTAPMPGAVQVKDASGKVVATAKSPQAAEMFKKGDVTLGNPEEMHEEDIGKHNNATTGFDALVRKLTPKYGKEAATKIAGAQMKKIKEADQPPNDSLLSPMSEARAKADDKAEKAGKKVAKDIEYDEGHKGKDDNKAEKAGKKVTKDIEYDEKKKDKIDEGMMDKLKGIMVPKLMKLLGPDAEKIASAVKQATGGDFTPSKENAIKVVKALGIDKAAAQGQSPQMAEGIAGNWQGKLYQALYTMGLLGSAGAATAMYGTVSGSWFATVGVLLLMFAGTFFDNAPGQIGAMGNFGNKGTSMQRGLDDHGMPIRNTNVDESTKKKKVKEGMEHKLKAARHTGKAHALSKQGYNCGYDDMEESRHYHEGYKEGLDECYGQMPIQGYVGEANNEVADMASYGAHTPTMEDDMYEMDKTSYMKQQAIKTPGDTFKAFGQTFKDKEVVESPFAFEAWEKELNSILEGKDVTEGMTVSISKGQQGSPDSVSVSAQDAEADQLLGIIKSAGLGLFGGDDAGHSHTGQPMTVDVDGGEGPQANIEVVDDHDDMLSLIRKMTGQGPAQANGDYEEEGGHEDETCESCSGMMEEGHSCGEAVEEDESMDQREYEVAEEINPNNNDEAEEEQTDATRDAALATAAGKNFADTDAPLEEGGDGGEASDAGAEGVDIADVADETEEDLEESLANGADDTFEADINFMTKVISDGLNGQKSTGQTTIPVVSTQVNRLGSPMRESTDLLTDWRKLSGIK